MKQFFSGYVIPVELCQLVLTKKLVGPFQLYVHLKTLCSGKIKLDKHLKESVASSLGITTRTVENHLRKLIVLKWISISPRSGIYFVCGFERVMKIQGITRRTSVVYKPSFENRFKAFLISAVIASLIKRKGVQFWVERKNRRSITTQKTPTFYPIASLALAKVLSVSVWSAFQYKQLAEKAGFVEIKRSYIKTGIKAKDAPHYKISHPETAHKVRIINGFLYLQAADRIVSNLHIKSRRIRDKQ